MNGGTGRGHHIDQILQRLFAARIGATIVVRWREDADWPVAGHRGTIVAAERHGVRLALQSHAGEGRFPAWIAYRDLWISTDSPYRVVSIETPALQDVIEAVLRPLRMVSGVSKEVSADVAPVA